MAVVSRLKYGKSCRQFLWLKRATLGICVTVKETTWAQGVEGALSPSHCWTSSMPGSTLGSQCWQESKMSKAGFPEALATELGLERKVEVCQEGTRVRSGEG